MKTIFKILIISAIISLVWLFLSCSLRKVKIEKQKEETKTEITDNSVTEKQTESNIKIEAQLKVYDKNESYIIETTYSPEDPTKEAYIVEKDGTKVILNNSKKIVKTETKKNNTQTEQFVKTEQLKKDAEKEQKSVKQVNTSTKENKSKEVEKEPFKWRIIVWGLIAIVVIYYFYRKYKNLITF